MGRLQNLVHEFFAPAIPAAIRDDLVLFTASQLQRQARLLYLVLLLTTPAAWFAASPGASFWIRGVAPLLMALVSVHGIWHLGRDLGTAGSVQGSRKFIRDATIVSSCLAVLCSTWSVFSWFGAPADARVHYPMMVALGAFSTAYCLSCVRIAAINTIVINIAPITVLLLSSSNRLELALGCSLLVATVFQLQMVVRHQQSITSLLLLQRQSRELARTDPLTGLLNRRALLDHALAMGPDDDLRLMLIDIDNFKAINDGHGHQTGDDVLVEIAQCLGLRAAIEASVARIGGEEFAILGHAAALPEALALALLTDVRNHPMPCGLQVTISIGIASGRVTSEADFVALSNRADAALYQAKHAGRNRVISAEAELVALSSRAA